MLLLNHPSIANLQVVSIRNMTLDFLPKISPWHLVTDVTDLNRIQIQERFCNYPNLLELFIQ